MKTQKQSAQDKPLSASTSKARQRALAPGEPIQEIRELNELVRQLDAKLELPTGYEVKTARLAAGYMLKDAAEIFGYQLRSWQKKEESGSSHRQLSIGEWHFLLLLAGQHPEFQLVRKEIPPVKD